MALLRSLAVTAVASLLLSSSLAVAQDRAAKKKVNTVHAVALFPFEERGLDVKDLGQKASDLLFAHLVARPQMYLVDREDLQKTLDEQELSLSGLVNPATANQVGQLTGARVLIVGSVLQVGGKLYVIAKVIGVETSRVLGASVKGNVRDDLDSLAENLAEQIATTIERRGGELVAASASREERVAELAKQLGKARRPTLWIDVPERHIGQPSLDPAAATELALIAKAAGFPIVDPEQGDRSQADVLLLGEGFSEFAARHGNLVSVKARLELKAVERKSGRVLGVGRQTVVGVDLAEQAAAKSALEEAAANLAPRLLLSAAQPDEKPDEKDAKKKGAGKKRKKKN